MLFVGLVFLLFCTQTAQATSCRDIYKEYYDGDVLESDQPDPLTIFALTDEYHHPETTKYCVCSIFKKSVCFPEGYTFTEGDIGYYGEDDGNGCSVMCGMSSNKGEICTNVCQRQDWSEERDYGPYFDYTDGGAFTARNRCLRPFTDACCEGGPTFCHGRDLYCPVHEDVCELPQFSGCLKCVCNYLELYEAHSYGGPAFVNFCYNTYLDWYYGYTYPSQYTHLCCMEAENPMSCNKKSRSYSTLEQLYNAIDSVCETFDKDFLKCNGTVVTDTRCCPVRCVQPGESLTTSEAPCDCEGLSANSTDGWKLDIQSDSKQDPHRALGVIPGIKVGGRKRLFIKRDDDSSFCLHSLYMKILCVKEVYIKINLDNGEVVKDTVEIDFPQEYEANLGPFDYNNVHSVRLGFKKWVDNCPSAHTYSLQLNTCDPSGN